MTAALSIFSPPYQDLHPVPGSARPLDRCVGRAGEWVIWSMDSGANLLEEVAQRPGGLQLIVVLPPAAAVSSDPGLLRMVERCRPNGVLPFHPAPALDVLRQLIRRPLDDVPSEVISYLVWRGFVLESDTKRLVSAILEKAQELRSVAALARGLYQSRRALGRHLLRAQLPVPSHWLHFGRILHATTMLQSTSESLFTVANRMGYPDGFSLSNQMKRLTGIRPRDVRLHLGWEWIVEAWLAHEAAGGALTVPRTVRGLVPCLPLSHTPLPSGEVFQREARDSAGKTTS